MDKSNDVAPLSETFGVEGRGAFYESAGTLHSIAAYPPADITIERIGELINVGFSVLLNSDSTQ